LNLALEPMGFGFEFKKKNLKHTSHPFSNIHEAQPWWFFFKKKALTSPSLGKNNGNEEGEKKKEEKKRNY